MTQPTGGTQPPSPTVVAHLAQSFRVDAAVSSGSAVVTASSGDEDIEFFTIDSNGHVINFFPDEGSATGYSQRDTGLTASTVLAAGLGSDGRMVVFSASGSTISYVAQDPTQSSGWGPVGTAVAAGDWSQFAVHMISLEATNLGGTLCVSAVATTSTAGDFVVGFATWNGAVPTFSGTSSVMPGWPPLSAWVHDATIGDVLAVPLGSGMFFPPTSSTAGIGGWHTVLSFDAVSDTTGVALYVAVLAGTGSTTAGDVYWLDRSTSPWQWVSVSSGLSIMSVRASKGVLGAIDLFGLAVDGSVLHWQQQGDPAAPSWSDPAVLATGMVAMDRASDADGCEEVFLTGSGHDDLSRLYQDETTTNWVLEPIEVTGSGGVEVYSSYVAEISIYDASGVPLPSTACRIWSDELDRVTVNGATYFLDAAHPATAFTSESGVLRVARQIDSLAVPTIEVAPPYLTSGTSYSVPLNDNVQQTLATIQPIRLSQAKDTEGNAILSTAVLQNQDSLNDLATSLRSSMSLAGGTTRQSRLRSPGDGPADTLRAGDVPDQHWGVDFEDGRIRYSQLTPEQAQARIATSANSLTGGVRAWIGTIGDVVAQVSRGVATVASATVSAAGGAVNASIDFTVGTVQYAYQTAVTSAHQAFDFAQLCMAQAGAAFDAVFQWLGTIFDWDAILRSQLVIAHAFNEFLAFLRDGVEGLKTNFDAGMATFIAQADSWFDRGIASIGSSTLSGYAQSNAVTSPTQDAAHVSNVLYHGVMDNASRAQPTTTIGLLPLTGDLQTLQQQLTGLRQRATATSQFDAMTSYGDTLGAGIGQLAQQLITGLLETVKGLVHALLSGVQSVVDAILSALEALLEGVAAVLNVNWTIPFVSDLFTWMTTNSHVEGLGDGLPLSALNLFALIIAAPTTVAYTLIFRAPPFADDAAVTAINARISSVTMLSAAGLSTTTTSSDALTPAPSPTPGTDEDPPWTGLLAERDAKFFAVGGAVSEFVLGMLSAYGDAHPAGTETFAATLVSTEAWCVGAAWQMFAFPWWSSAGSLNCSVNHVDAGARWMWVYQNLGVGLDLLYLVAITHKLARWSDEVGIVSSAIYGGFHLALACWASDGKPAKTWVTNVTGVAAEPLRILRLPAIVDLTDAASLAVIALADILFYGTGAGLSLQAVMPPDDALAVPATA